MKEQIIRQLTDIRDNFRKMVNQLKEDSSLVDTSVLDLIDEINSLSVEI